MITEDEKRTRYLNRIHDIFNNGKGLSNDCIPNMCWRVVTRYWDKGMIRSIISLLHDCQLKIVVFDLMISEWTYEHPDMNDEERNFYKWLTGYKRHIIIANRIINTLRHNRIKKEVANSKEVLLKFPEELKVCESQKYFIRAIEKGFIEKEGNNYKWVFGAPKGQARLGYFCYRVYSPPRPISKLEELFCVKKLSSSITSADVYFSKKYSLRSDVREWMHKMDCCIFYD